MRDKNDTEYEGQIGKIVSVNEDDKASVKIERHPACKKCGACNLGLVDNSEKTFKVLNTVDASVGDFVILGIRSGTVLRASFIVYIIPLLAFLGGLVAGNIYGREVGINQDLSSFIAGGALLVLAFIFIKIYDIKVGQRSYKYQPFIVRLASENEAKAMIDEEECEESSSH